MRCGVSRYDIVTDADGWAIAGHSLGGIASISTGLYWPERFHKMLTASASFPNKGGDGPYLSKAAMADLPSAPRWIWRGYKAAP